MKLSKRRSKFVNEYILDHNGSRAARDAGYATSGARVTAHRLLTNANVKAAIESKKHNLAQKYELKMDDVVSEIQHAIEIAKYTSNPLAIIKGWIEIAKLMGFYSHQESIEVGFKNLNTELLLKLETLTDQELLEISSKNKSNTLLNL